MTTPELWKPSVKPRAAELCEGLILDSSSWRRPGGTVLIPRMLSPAEASGWFAAAQGVVVNSQRLPAVKHTSNRQRSVKWDDAGFSHLLTQHGNKTSLFKGPLPYFYELTSVSTTSNQEGDYAIQHYVITPPSWHNPEGKVWVHVNASAESNNKTSVQEAIASSTAEALLAGTAQPTTEAINVLETTLMNAQICEIMPYEG